MKDCRRFYIDGKWVRPAKAHDYEVINPASEDPIAGLEEFLELKAVFGYSR
jgi:hypothetical protein